ncbi:hypothetical protein LUZ60_000510 [Juncus effusus]|nr:hypothetical protein LUZ60_000510 [Juncus effusus]
MDPHKILPLLFLCFFIISLSHPSVASGSIKGEEELSNYVVIVRERPSDVSDVATWHSSLLSTVIPDSSRLIYSYDQVVNGFAARLSKKEIETLSKKDWFVDAHLSRRYKLATTVTPSFLGLRQSAKHPDGLWNISKMGEGMIIGVIDSGITPGHPSFNDEGMSPPPAKWKGHCDFNKTMCNNKLIGAVILKKGIEKGHPSPVDSTGHGTHTSSTAAGAFVKDAGEFGISFGVASGMAPRAHIAMYEICEDSICDGVDFLKAIEVAVNDGVDILSLSITEVEIKRQLIDDGTLKSKPGPLGLSDDIMIGAFYAMSHGVFVSAAASNNGPVPGSVSNDAPWILTVGASTTDRRLASVLRLQNGMEFKGEMMNEPAKASRRWMPLTYFNMSTPAKDARGSIVVLKFIELRDNNAIELTQIMAQMGAATYILIKYKGQGTAFMDPDQQYLAPTVHMSYDDGDKLLAYLTSHPKTFAKINFKGPVLKEPNSLEVAKFSSRGPSVIFQGILKPDIIGSGVKILAASPDKMKVQSFHKKAAFAIRSGTSMSTPHLSGIAALIKKVHPNWTPAAIKSAIMTTAYAYHKEKPINDYTQFPADYLAIGAGHVDPRKAVEPGLVYDLKPEDYIPYLCGMGFNDTVVQTVVYPLRFNTCSQVKKISEEQLNYPSIRINMKANLTTTKIERTVTNVGDALWTYHAKLDVPKGVYAYVRPKRLYFTKKNEKRRFTITFKKMGKIQEPAQGQLRWISKKHVVRSPITIATDANADYASMKCNNFNICE